MTEDMLLRIIIFAVISIMSFWGWRWLGVMGNISDPSPPVLLDPDEASNILEARCIDEQNRWGRELNGYVWKNKE